jgi:MFS family permease
VPANHGSILGDPSRAHRVVNFVGTAMMDTMIACTGLGLSLLGAVRGSPFNVPDFNFHFAVLLAVAGLVTAFGSVYLSRLSDQFGRRPLILVSTLGISLTSLLFAWASAWWHLHAIIIARSAFMGMFWPSLEARITDGADGRQMTRRLGQFGIAFCIGVMLGHLLSGWLHDQSVRIPFYVAAGIGLVLLAVFHVVFRLDRSHDGHVASEPEDIGLKNGAAVPAELRRAFLWSAWLGNALAYASLGILRNMFPRFAKLPVVRGGLGFTGLETGLVAAAISVAMLLVFMVLGRWHKWHYRYRYMVGSQLAMLAGAAMFVSASSISALMVGSVLFGAGIGMVYISSIYYSLAGKSQRAGQSGLHEAVICLGSCGGMVVVAAVSLGVGAHRTPYWVCSGLLLAGIIVQAGLWFRARRRLVQ